MIELQKVSFRVGKKSLLNDISLQLSSGKLHLIIGPNGAGKTTLLRLMSAEQKPSHGSILLDGQALQDYSLSELARFRAVLSQHTELAFPLTVNEVVMLGRYPHRNAHRVAEELAICSGAMHCFDVAHFGERDYLSLSGGEQQRVQCARVLAQIWEPMPNHHRSLMLDEPLTFLDIHHQYGLMEQLRRQLNEQSDFCIVGIVHDLNIAARFADTITLLHEGNMIAHGTVAEVLTREHIRKVYGMEPNIFHENNQMHIAF